MFVGAELEIAATPRQRGSIDSFQSFDAMGGAQPIASFGQIMQLLGTGRAQVA